MRRYGSSAASRPGTIERGDGHVINVSSWRVLPESTPLFGVYNASKAALSAVSRVIETELAELGVHSTTIYYPLVDTPMIAPTRAYDGLAALTADEAADWMVTAARTRPVRSASKDDASPSPRHRGTASAQRRHEAPNSQPVSDARPISDARVRDIEYRTHRPENLTLGALLTTAAFLCVALVGALAKVSGQYTSTGVLLLFQNVICLLFILPVALRGGWPSYGPTRSACTSCAQQPALLAGTRFSSRSP